MLKLDHIAVAAQTLEAGCDWVQGALAARPGPGGTHTHFGTHNRLLGLEDGLYLEVIAIDPDAPPLGHARWFDLDRFDGAPRIGNWICRTDDMNRAQAALPGIGAEVALERGDLRWRMAVPQDGRLPFDDCHPAIIQWDCAEHPAEMLPPSGIVLRGLTVSHPEAETLSARMAPLLRDPRIIYRKGPPGLRAAFDTPHGRRVLG